METSFPGEADVEGPLTEQARARLPFLRLVRLYLDPGALFKDANRGTASARRSALAYNRRMRWMLLPYARRWSVIASFLFLTIEPAQTLSWIAAAACAVAGTIALTVIVVTFVAYFLLDAPEA